MREKYESLALADLKEIAKSRGIKGVSTMKKRMLWKQCLQKMKKQNKSGKAQFGSGQRNGSWRNPGGNAGWIRIYQKCKLSAG